jgi:RNA polymerase sigma-70 factor, ECF subfamily
MGRSRHSAHGGSLSQLRRLADEELMAFAQRDDARAFEVIYERHAAAAFSLAYRMCGSTVGAEDVVQDAFLAMWRRGDRYEPGRGSVRTWALGIVHNRAIDALRRNDVRNRRRAADEGITERLAATERIEVEVAQREAAESVRGLMDELPEEQSKVIELAYFGGFTTREIARMLDAPLGTIKGRMRLGLEKLRAKLDGVELSEALP